MTAGVHDREVTAARLLRSSLDHSYDPHIDIDWDAPLVDGLWGMPQHRSSLYGTELWDGLTEDQRRTLTIHETCSVARIGLWFEIILMQMLLRYAYDRDPRTGHVQYALTEIADECRHSIMFGKMIERYGVPDYKPRPAIHRAGRVFKTIASGPAMFTATLFVEEVLDQFQRESMRDETVQPLSRMINKIHVTEEARHVRYARDELARLMPEAGPVQRRRAQLASVRIASIVTDNLVHPDVYAAVGIEPEVGRRAARDNPHWQETLRWSARKLVPFLREQGIIAGFSETLWRKANLL